MMPLLLVVCFVFANELIIVEIDIACGQVLYSEEVNQMHQ